MTSEELLHLHFPHLEGKLAVAPGLEPMIIREFHSAGDYFRCYNGDRSVSEHTLVVRKNILKFLVEPIETSDLTSMERQLFDNEVDSKLEIL